MLLQTKSIYIFCKNSCRLYLPILQAILSSIDKCI